MLYLVLFCIATLGLFEYLYSSYKQSKYYKEEIVSISYVGDLYSSKEAKNISDKLKIKEL
jgi:hypothetical protein